MRLRVKEREREGGAAAGAFVGESSERGGLGKGRRQGR